MALRNIINSLDNYIIHHNFNHLLLRNFICNLLKNSNTISKDKYLQEFKYNHLENTYEKQIVHRNKLYSLEVISWGSNSKSPIHNHAEYGCFMKVLNGSLKENLYNPELEFIKETQLEQYDVSYINNDIGIHSIENKNNLDMSYSLHIYFPGKYNTKYYILK
jgi:predicted metal-dependent enzyme (double-stranded beta helix superfamily)